MMRNTKLKKYFSAQTNKQIEIGFETTQFGVEESKSSDGIQILSDLITLSLKRDESWKSFYTERMNEIEPKVEDFELLELLDLERKAEQYYSVGDYKKAIETLQKLIDDYIPTSDKTERGWYLQEMARYSYQNSKMESSGYQMTAYKTNRYLLKPTNGVEFQKLKINKTRNEAIRSWIKQFESFEEMKIKVNDLTHKLTFGIKADKFEESLCEIGRALGFASERPDKEHKKGPDNLWNIQANDYILFECKNEVDEKRSDINKAETGQMNVSCAWFKENYNGETVKNIMIIPSNRVSPAGAFSEDVEILKKHGLSKLNNNIRNFFNEFKDYDIKTLTESQIEESLTMHKLTIQNILNDYTDKLYKSK
jgi:tetratricopeptide (TPR) repeat protein